MTRCTFTAKGLGERNGTDWTPVESNTTSALFRICGSGPDDVWAVRELGTIVLSNGTIWLVVPATAIQ